MALAGFTGSEVGSKYPRDPAVLKPMLDIRGIQICNAWFSTFFANGQREKPLMIRQSHELPSCDGRESDWLLRAERQHPGAG